MGYGGILPVCSMIYVGQIDGVIVNNLRLGSISEDKSFILEHSMNTF